MAKIIQAWPCWQQDAPADSMARCVVDPSFKSQDRTMACLGQFILPQDE